MLNSYQVTQGVDRAPNRSLFNALGFTKEELELIYSQNALRLLGMKGE